MDKTSFNLKSILVNCTIKEKVRLINNESIAFNFSFNDFLNDASFGSPVLNLNPVQGIIQPKSELPIYISFTPNSEKVYNYNLVCSVKKKPTPIVLNVKGEGYVIHEYLEAEKPTGETYELIPTVNQAPAQPVSSNFVAKAPGKRGATNVIEEINIPADGK